LGGYSLSGRIGTGLRTDEGGGKRIKKGWESIGEGEYTEKSRYLKKEPEL